MPVRQGPFFHLPAPLPRGRHKLTREEVLAAQRERLMIAVCELMAEAGFGAVTVGEVASRAAVSRAAFYDSFADLEACAFAAYDRFIDVLLQHVIAALDPTAEMSVYVEGALRGYLQPLQTDPVVARAFQVEMDAVGISARKRRREALQMFAGVIGKHHRTLAEHDTTLRPLADSAYLAIVYGVRQLASDALDTEGAPELLELVPDLSAWIMQSLNGA